MTTILDVSHLLIDMDGVLYRGDLPLPRLPEFIAFLRERPIPFVLVTNNSTRTPQQYADKLARMGIEIDPAQVLTSGQATARYLARSYPPGTRVHVFGMDSLREAILEEGFVLADENVAVVVASMDRDVTYEKLKRASLLIRSGALFVATNLDPTQPTDEGLLPGTGSMITALQTASETEPVAIGKPESTMFELAMQVMDAQPHTTAILGDRVDTDLAGGRQAGCRTIGVLSGSSSRAEMEAFGPDFLFEDIAHLLDAWQWQ
ncbi:MAG: HAD-IIA family hydrolase [Anaerolineae bacterium]